MVLDRAAGAGGLLLAQRERFSAAWARAAEARLFRARLPPVRLAQPALASASALAFALLAAGLPAGGRGPARDAAVARVQGATLKAEVLAAETEVPEAAKEELERLEAEAAEGRFGADDWAAADAAEEALDAQAAARGSDLASAEAAAREMAGAIEANADAEAQARAREGLEQALAALGSAGGRPAGEENRGHNTDFFVQALDAASGIDNRRSPVDIRGVQSLNEKIGIVSPVFADARALERALAKRRETLAKAFGLRGESGSQEGEGDCEGGGACEAREGGARGKPGRRSGEGKESSSEGESREEGEPGRGGVTRGPGRALVTFGDELPEQRDRLRMTALPRGDTGEPGELLGLVRSAPRPRGDASPTRRGAAAEGSEGVAPSQEPVSPRHRDAVRRYFDDARPGRADDGGNR